jgi:diaminopimelate epimerase
MTVPADRPAARGDDLADAVIELGDLPLDVAVHDRVELVRRLGPTHIAMRVHERGVGETPSCGTGVCAAAVASMDADGARTSYDVDVPGGRLTVKWCDGGNLLLTGPAVLVAHGETDGLP